ncbi:hypothetical protein [Marinicrinis lubricantis]|uniref:Uncharacterized protein n=1 Tax=Marinicrinis lubricantis TaxID=2086470 RepID=A0ABW1IVP0_9BACL
MKQLLLRGWRTAYGHPLLILMFYFYHFIWGFFLYRLIRSITVPILQRYPGDVLNPMDLKLYWLEFHFRLTKTDMIEPYLWGLGGLLLLRMVLTPILQSGLFYTFHVTGHRQRRSFRKGVQKYAKVFALYYGLRVVLTAAPLYWLLPLWIGKLQTHYELLPYLEEVWLTFALYLVYLIFLKLIFMYNQFRLLTETELLKGITSLSTMLHRSALISAAVFGVVIAATSLYFLASWLWAGLLAVILYQVYHLVRVLFRFWEIGSHYELWKMNHQQ